jgi:hypothetical protein
LSQIPEFKAYTAYLDQAVPENSSLPLKAYNTLPFNPDFIFKPLSGNTSIAPNSLTKQTLMFRLMTTSFLKKYGYIFFEYFYNHIEKNEADEQVQNVERFKEELIILALRTLTDYEKLFKLLEPRFGVMYTSGFMRFFFRLYWA